MDKAIQRIDFEIASLIGEAALLKEKQAEMKPKDYKKERKRIEDEVNKLRSIKMYLETKPTTYFVNGELKRLHNLIGKIIATEPSFYSMRDSRLAHFKQVTGLDHYQNQYEVMTEVHKRMTAK